ncbi:NAD-dependent DNA ligase [Candidatus Phytoplasma australiense]|uniref:DNA ligase n=1 Tax=Phytoplasma australiense TaxID=59748 RepID=DNLJ_PHYAS|nr:RecName: Full=DNA ligase; AltName: Full=Polydeoxyribonucleotide synthase [NAD(+)] [Candidatus Phytoplasma australiense]CAM12104.1 NAD-dependent DNA ligase [Candidatus Phytoplasma australiense]
MINLELIEKKIKDLTNQLNEANYEYYVKSNPKLTDQQYDALLKELLVLEKKFPQFTLPYSPTLKIGGFVEKKFSTVKHTSAMMSLANAFNLKELKAFYDRIAKKFSSFSMVSELKIDGVAVSLKYKKGILFQALTRGNGVWGEEITKNVQTIKQVPLKLTQPLDLEVRGEIYLSNSSFQKLNQQRKIAQQPLFSNPRNAASGTIRQLNSSIVAQRNLSIFIYSIQNPYLLKSTQEETLTFLASLGFSVNPYYKCSSSFEELEIKIQELEKLQQNLDYNTDGVVVKINELNLHDSIGKTTKSPKWAIAYKFATKNSESVVQEIIFQVGRSGMLTPVCKIIPVMVDGSLVSKVVLHNYDYICKKDIRLKDYVQVHKAGSVIPEIKEVIKSKRPSDSKPFAMITQCPSCHSLLNKNKGEVDYFCINKNCLEQKIQKLIHFVSKNAMDIDTLGNQTLITFFNQKLIENPSDIYLLKNNLDVLQKINGFGAKKVQNILTSVEKSKNKSLENVLFGLGIKHVGLKVSQVLTKHFDSIEILQKTTLENLESIKSIPEIGEKIALSLQKYFQNPLHLEEITKLKQLGVSFKSTTTSQIKAPNFFTNKKVVLTGSLQNYTRSQIKKLLIQKGAIINDALSSQTHLLITGANPGSKLQKAKTLNIQIIEEKELEELIQEK